MYTKELCEKLDAIVLDIDGMRAEHLAAVKAALPHADAMAALLPHARVLWGDPVWRAAARRQAKTAFAEWLAHNALDAL